MKMHYLQHVPFEGPGYIQNIADEQKIQLTGTALYRGQKLPDTENFDTLIIMGGPMGTYDEDKFPWLVREKYFIEKCILNNKKIIGICLGAQLIADVLGAKVYKNQHREIGWFQLIKTGNADKSQIGQLIPDSFYAFHWHGDTYDIPEGAIHLCESEACKNQAFIYDERVLGLQFHLESTVESIDLLIKNCEDEIDGSRYVQDKEQLRDRSYLEDSNLLMKKIIAGETVIPF